MVTTYEFNAREFQALGVKIAKTYTNEAGYRTAVGRVYYACHLIGMDAVSNKGWFSPGHSREDHSGLWRKLKEHGNNSLADQLRELCGLREHADHHIRNCPAGMCTYCDSVPKGKKLVDSKTWQRADEIASYILPKLECIDPKKSHR